LQTLDITYNTFILTLSVTQSDDYLWVRLHFADVLKMESYPPLRLSLFLG